MRRIVPKIKQFLSRHPFLYYMRYYMFAANAKHPESALETFNEINSVADVDLIFHEIAADMRIDPNISEFEKAKAIGMYLRNRVKPARAVSLSARKTLEIMLDKGGVCGDFSLVLNTFCLIYDIPCREYHGVDKIFAPTVGHTFNEIYDRTLGRWIFIDVHKGIHYSDASGNLISVATLFQSLREKRPIQMHYFSEYRPPKPERLPLIYSDQTIPYLISRYRLRKIDPILDRLHNWPAFVSQFTLFVLGRNPRYLFILDDYRKKLLRT